MSRSNRHRNRGNTYFATAGLGLERILTSELRRLGITPSKTFAGGVAFKATRKELIRACFGLRTAHRVLWSIGKFRATCPDTLYEGAKSRIQWEHFISEQSTFSVYATCRESEITHTQFAALRVKDAIVDRLREVRGVRPSVDPRDADIPIRVRINREQVTVSIDGAGASLSQRGYRVESGPAPLRESLAAGLVLLSGWRGARPLFDPLCGSGTIPIEASLIAKDVAPGLLGRRFAYEKWPGHREKLMDAARDAAHASVKDVKPLIFGSDKSARVLDVARANQRRAEPYVDVDWRCADVHEMVNPCPGEKPGVIISNPPYGERLSDAEAVGAMLKEMGGRLRAEFSGWDVWLLLTQKDHEKALGLPIERRFSLKNGALDVVAIHAVVP